jgi:hypothetical protein
MGAYMIGKVARNLDGKIGVISDVEITIDDGWIKNAPSSSKIYKGIGLDGSEWVSRKPTVVANSIQDYINRYITKYMDPTEAGKLV